MSRPHLLALAACLSACSCLAPRPIGASGEAGVLLISAGIQGYLEPCGCSETMRGGLARTATVIERARAAGPALYLDSGDTLFSHPRLAEEAVPQQELKARTVAAALRTMNLSAHGVGELDLVRGEAFAKAQGLPDQSRGARLLALGGRMVAAVYATDEADLLAFARSAREQGASFVVAFVHRPLADVRKMASAPGLAADLLVVSHGDDPLAGAENRWLAEPVPVAVVQSRGRSLLRVDLSLRGDGRVAWLAGQEQRERELATLDQRIELLRRQVNEPMLGDDAKRLRRDKLQELFSRREALAAAPLPEAPGRSTAAARFVPIESSLPAQPEVKALVALYDRQVGELNLENARAHGRDCPTPAAGQAAYVGNEPCRECHQEAFPAWQQTKHARAFEALEAVGKGYHLDCVPCHLTGYGQPGGVCRIDKLQGRTDVGCESCHGPGSLHVDVPSRRNVRLGKEAEACTGCHDAENSPHFDLARYLSFLRAPGHGLPLPEGMADAGAPPFATDAGGMDGAGHRHVPGSPPGRKK